MYEYPERKKFMREYLVSHSANIISFSVFIIIYEISWISTLRLIFNIKKKSRGQANISCVISSADHKLWYNFIVEYLIRTRWKKKMKK